jgi:hypothetical protein
MTVCGMDSRYWSSLKSFSSRRSDEPDVEIENCGYSGSTTSLDILRETASGAAQARADLTSRMEERGGIEDIVTTWDGVGGGGSPILLNLRHRILCEWIPVPHSHVDLRLLPH